MYILWNKIIILNIHSLFIIPIFKSFLNGSSVLYSWCYFTFTKTFLLPYCLNSLKKYVNTNYTNRPHFKIYRFFIISVRLPIFYKTLVLEKEIFKVHQCDFAILLLSTLEKDVTVHLNKFKSPSPEHALCCFLLKLGQWSLKIFKN